MIPYAQSDHDRATARFSEWLAPHGVEITGVHTCGRSRARRSREAEAIFVTGGNSFRLVSGTAPAVVDRPGALGDRPRHSVLRRERRCQRRLPDDPDHQRHADRATTELRGVRPGAVPDQPALHRSAATRSAHRRDARGAPQGVPRGERRRASSRSASRAGWRSTARRCTCGARVVLCCSGGAPIPRQVSGGDRSLLAAARDAPLRRLTGLRPQR